MNSIVLTGFMGTGKSAVGKVLAEKLSFKIIDTDAMIEEKAGTSISEIFRTKGEAVFREYEEKVIEEIAGSRNSVVITGGGAVIKEKNIENLRKCGKIVCLKATPEEIYNRVKYETHRPLLQVENPIDRIKELLNAREEFYKKADFSIDTTGLKIEEVADKVIETLNLKSSA
ncbi:MAG: shikimate kinase [Candidatus Schekmanbacteria bacterium]|nr:MAG: shikimate kinase [Candidatus Schekmanbacteria bacterium]